MACPELNIGSQGLQIRMPGGPTLQVMTPEINPDGLQIVKNLLTQASAGLAPLQPVFTIIDAVLALKGFADAIPDSLGPPPDPSALVDALAEVAEKVAAVAALIPQLSVPFTVVDVIDAAIAALNGVVTQLEAVVAQEARIAAAATTASEPGNEGLLTVVACAEDVNVSVKNGISEGLGPLNSLLGVLDILLGLVPGAPEVPSLDSLPDDAQEGIDFLRDFVDVLQQVRSAVPIP